MYHIKNITHETLSLAINYLKKSSDDSPFSFFTENMAAKQWLDGDASIAFAMEENSVIGCFCLTIRAHKDRKYLMLPLFHGERIAEWRDQFVEYLFMMAKANNCTDFYMMGRKGWGKLFPEMDHIACVYGRHLI